MDELGIEDSYINASKTFVRAELVPDNNEWWLSPEDHPEAWRFIVDQDITPDWFDKGESEKTFRASVYAWWRDHVMVDKKINELSKGYYMLKRCEVKKLCNDVRVYLDSSQVGGMMDNSRVGEMRGSSQVGEMWGSSQVGKMRGSSQVGEMWDSSQVGKMRGSSQVGEMRGNSQVGGMMDNSRVGEMRGNSQVGEMWDSSQVGEMWDSSQVGEMRDSSQVGEMWDSSQVGEMWDSSMARSFKSWPKIQIIVSDADKFEMVSLRTP